VSTTFTTNLGLGIPNTGDASYVSTFANDLNAIDSGVLGAFGVSVTENPSATLNVRINGGTMIASTGSKILVSSIAAQAMTANSTNSIYVSDAGAISVSTSGFPAIGTFHVPLATVVTGSSTVTSIVDARLPYGSCGANRNALYLSLAGGNMTGPISCTGTGNSAGVILSAVSAPGAPSEGQLWNDSTQKALAGFVDGQTGYFHRLFYAQTNSVNFNTTNTATPFIGSGIGSVTLNAGVLTVGKTLRVKASGFFPTTNSAAGTFNFLLKLGSVTVATLPSAPTLGNSLTNAPWSFECDVTVRAIGSGTSTNVFAQGAARLPMTNSDNQTLNTQGIANSAVSSGFDSTVSNAINLLGQFGTSSANNSATCTNLTVEVLG
jgi:hypothetical protein